MSERGVADRLRSRIPRHFAGSDENLPVFAVFLVKNQHNRFITSFSRFPEYLVFCYQNAKH